MYQAPFVTLPSIPTSVSVSLINDKASQLLGMDGNQKVAGYSGAILLALTESGHSPHPSLHRSVRLLRKLHILL
jgi:hypothetical protein